MTPDKIPHHQLAQKVQGDMQLQRPEATNNLRREDTKPARKDIGREIMEKTLHLSHYSQSQDGMLHSPL